MTDARTSIPRPPTSASLRRLSAGVGLATAGLLVLPGAAGAATPASGAAATAAAMPATAPGTGWVRFGHFATAQGPVTIDVDGAQVATNVTFRTVTPYRSEPDGTHQVTVTPMTGGGAPLTSTFTVVDGSAATAGIITGATSPKIQVWTDDLSAPPPGQAKVRIVQTDPAVGMVAATLQPGAVGGGDALPSALGAAVAFPATAVDSATGYLALNAGTYQVAVDPAAGGAPLVSGANWPVAAGDVASIVVVAATTGPTLEVLSDAVGASATPTGAVHTGEGGMAGHLPGLSNAAVGPAGRILSGLPSSGSHARAAYTAGAVTLAVAGGLGILVGTRRRRRSPGLSV